MIVAFMAEPNSERRTPFLIARGSEEVETIEMAADYIKYGPHALTVKDFLFGTGPSAEAKAAAAEFGADFGEPPDPLFFLHSIVSNATSEDINHAHEPDRQRLVLIDDGACVGIIALAAVVEDGPETLANFWKDGDKLFGTARAMLADIVTGFELAEDYSESLLI